MAHWGSMCAAASLLLLASPTAGEAHLRSGAVAVDYRASVTTADSAAYRAQIYQSDRGLSLTIKPGHAVTILGYLGEPMFRLDAAGLWVNASSPTAVVAGLVSKTQRVTAGAPRWRLHRGRSSAAWHDARAQGLPPGVDHGAWSVPLLVDGHPQRIEGELWRPAKPSLWLWLGMLAGLIGAGTAPLLLRRPELVRRQSIAFAGVAAAAGVVLALAFALDTYASPGTWIEGLDELAFLAVGLGVLLRGPPRLHVGAAIGVGLVAVAVGLTDGAVFLHPVVLAILPATVIRLVAVAAIGIGLGAVAVGLTDGAVFLHPVVLAILPATVIRLVAVAAIGIGLGAAFLGCMFYVEDAGHRSAGSAPTTAGLRFVGKQ